MAYTVREVLEFVEENDVKFIRLAFCDLFGRLKNISIMPDELPFAFEHGIAFDGSSIVGFRDIQKSDLILVPDPDTLSILPWRPQQGRVVRFYCNIKNPDETEFEVDTRAILQKAVDRCTDMGFTCELGEECEFYLFKQDENGEDTLIPYDKGTYFDVAPADKGENIRREICLYLEEMGIYPETSHHEAGPGQNEIVFRFANPVRTADNLLTFKNVVRTIATRNGLTACFQPKPLKGQSGNGLHINVSLSKNGVNIFREEKKEHNELAAHFMAGVLDKVNDITLFLNTQESSYERLGEFEAPGYISWSRQNRAQLLRIPSAIGDRKRFELRSPDPCINPYMAYALLIHAGLDGIEHQIKLPKSVDFDTTHASEKELKNLKKLPATIQEAIQDAQNSEFVKNILGEPLLTKYISLKEQNL